MGDQRHYESRVLLAREEAVVCALCGHTRHNLAKHLRAKHAIEPKAYERRYGSYVSEHFRAVQIDLLADQGIGIRHWTPERILERLRTFEQNPGWQTWKARRHKPSAATICRVFGSWNAAWEAAGFPTRRAHGPAGPRKKCLRGHALTGENVIPRADGTRLCRICRNRYLREKYPGRDAAGPRKRCRRGHPLTGENVIVRADGTRLCRICRNRYMRDYHRARATNARA